VDTFTHGGPEGSQMDTCDPVVIRAIKSVNGRKTTELWWEYSLHERTQAIYEEIRRLDGVRLKRMVALLAKRTVKRRH
jgi:hypothetical protein